MTRTKLTTGIAALLLLISCTTHVLTSSSTKATSIKSDITATATDVKTASKKIADEANAGKKDTPLTAQPFVFPHFDQILAETGTLNAAGQKLDRIGLEVDALKTQLDKEAGERVKLQKALDTANGKTTTMFRWLGIIAAIGIGVSIAIGVWAHDVSIGLSGAAGGGVVLGISLFVGAINPFMKWLCLAIIGIAGVWFCIQWFRKGLKRAVKPKTPAKATEHPYTFPGRHQ